MRFLQQSCDNNYILYLKIRIVPISYVANVSPIITEHRGAREITINELVARIFVTRIFGGNVELLLTLETSIE